MVDFVIGVDIHKRTHTFVAVDNVGRRLAAQTTRTTSSGHSEALQWARSVCGGTRLWGIEDLRNFSVRLESDLLAAGEAVVRVPPTLTARHRAAAGSWGKSDPIDALAVARAVLREGGKLPVATHDPYSRRIKLLVDHRDRLVVARTGTINRLLNRLHELDPTEPPSKLALQRVKHRATIEAQLAAHDGCLAEIAREELAEIADATIRVNSIEKTLTELVSTGAPALLAVSGCGTLAAAKIIGETAGIGRFATEPKYARYCGVAPVPDWSGSTIGRVRSMKGGNRQLNRALHTIAMTQIRKGGRGEPYYRRRISEGNNHAQALGRLKRQICRAVYYCQVADTSTRAGQMTTEPVPSRPSP